VCVRLRCVCVCLCVCLLSVCATVRCWKAFVAARCASVCLCVWLGVGLRIYVCALCLCVATGFAWLNKRGLWLVACLACGLVASLVYWLLARGFWVGLCGAVSAPRVARVHGSTHPPTALCTALLRCLRYPWIRFVLLCLLFPASAGLLVSQPSEVKTTVASRALHACIARNIIRILNLATGSASV